MFGPSSYVPLRLTPLLIRASFSATLIFVLLWQQSNSIKIHPKLETVLFKTKFFIKTVNVRLLVPARADELVAAEGFGFFNNSLNKHRTYAMLAKILFHKNIFHEPKGLGLFLLVTLNNGWFELFGIYYHGFNAGRQKISINPIHEIGGFVAVCLAPFSHQIHYQDFFSF